VFTAGQDNPQNLRFVILNTARELLAAGLELSMRGLAQRIGCSPGTIYLYFQNKSELLQCLEEESLARLTHILNRLGDRHRHGDPVVVLKKVLYTCVEFRLRHPAQYDASAIEQLVPSLQEFVRRCAEEDSLRAEVDESAACVSLTATIHGLTSMLMAGLFQTDRARLIEQVINSSVDGLMERSSNPRAHAASVA
jgi:AcrR family transcriptional regulator